MSGVIDDNGVQWEHCSHCHQYVRIERLRYEAPSAKYEFGRDLCGRCAPAELAPVGAPLRVFTP